MDVPQTLGKYEIRGGLGRGAMGVVYDGWDPLIARRVAIKSVPLPATPDAETAEEIARFRREAQAAGRLTHPNIVAVYDYGETSDLAYIVMEFVDGPTLKALLDKKERFPLDSIRRIMGDLLAGLQFSHERGVVHRDIKPANVMLTSQGQGKIADFGIARIEMSSMTQAGTMLGTPAYMSPEQFRGEAADARTDVYSSGVLLYQLLTGERPFEGGLTAIMHKVLNTEPPAPSQLAGTVPAALDAVVRKAMAKRPQDRFASAAAFADGLRAAIDGGAAATEADDETEATLVRPVRPPPAPAGGTVRAAPPSLPAAPPAKSRLPLFAGIGIVAIAAIAGGGWFLTRPAPTLTPTPVQTADTTSPGTPAETKPAVQVQPPATAEVQPTPAATTPKVQPADLTVAPVPAPAPAAPAPAAPTPAPAPVAKPVQAPAVPPATTTTTAAPAQTPMPAETQAPAAPSKAATTPPPAPPAAATQTAAVLPAAMLQEIAQTLRGTRCTLADAMPQDGGGFLVHGFADAAAAVSLHNQVANVAGTQPVAWHVQTIDPVFCPALALLRPISPAAGGPSPGVGLALYANRTVLQDGQSILPRIAMPDFAGELRVDYIGHDGTLAHLYPTLADPAAKLNAQTSRKLAAGEHLALGDPGPGRPQWVSGTPYGTDMIIAVASSVPLRVSAPHNAEEKGDTYLADLARAVEQARAAGARVSGALLLVDTVPKTKAN